MADRAHVQKRSVSEYIKLWNASAESLYCDGGIFICGGPIVLELETRVLTEAT